MKTEQIMGSVRLGRTGQNITPIGLGTWPFSGPRKVGRLEVGWSGHDDGRARNALERAWQLGINHWDTADTYGDGRAEAIIGSIWDRVPRDEIFLASKVGWDPGAYKHFYHPELIAARIERSLKLLQTDRLDLYYLHHCDFGADDRFLDEAIQLVRRFRNEGKIRFLGLSDWSSEKVARLLERVDPDVVQIYRNVIDDTYASSGLKAKVERRDLGVVFFSTIKHGLLLGKYKEPTRFEKGDMRNRIAEFRDPQALARFENNRRAIEKRFPDQPEALLRSLVGTLLEDSAGACVILGQRGPEQAEAAAAAGEPLDSEDARWVRELYRR
ncbi:MAG: aldo/keto reductase [Acidobacteriota bacterium]|nr:aldo/keto reductase [Acidobacteriota bacterium]